MSPRCFVCLPSEEGRSTWVDVDEIVAIYETKTGTLVYLRSVEPAASTTLNGRAIFDQIIDQSLRVTTDGGR